VWISQREIWIQGSSGEGSIGQLGGLCPADCGRDVTVSSFYRRRGTLQTAFLEVDE
jgi:hypothetical protein